MGDLNNFRSKKIFSGDEAKRYPLTGPVGAQYQVYYDNLTAACNKGNQKLTILELACGTGRYFHFLSNVEKLVGVDISADMLNGARENLKTMPELEPVCSLHNSSIEDFIPTDKFDFIYSIGTLGEYCEFNARLFAKIISYLKPGGSFFFTLVDSESFEANEYVWYKKRMMRFLLKFIPVRLRNKIDAKWLTYADWKHLFMSREQVENILKASSVPVKWELSKAKDSLHTHHICKVTIV